MLAKVEDAVRSVGRANVGVKASGPKVTVAWESTFLASPSAAVWAPTVRADRRECLLPPILVDGAG